MTPQLARSYSYCERLARREAGNFYPAFRLLPNRQRFAMCALYAFMRIADDLADGPESIEEKQRAVVAWGGALEQALTGNYSHPIHPALHHTLEHHRIPLQYLDDVLAGVNMDLAPVAYETFAHLYRYCYRVAAAVGLACIHVWGFKTEKAKEYAESAGIAFQLTNILRDLAEDARRQRIYLPRDELDRFGYSALQLARGERTEGFRRLMRFQVERARRYYEEGLGLAPLLHPSGRAVFVVMLRTYRGLLDTIERRDYDVFSGRIQLSRWAKLGILLRALPLKFGFV